jgi:hypothetical protein
MPYINQNHPEHGAFAAPQPGIAEHFVEIYTPPTAVVADWDGFRQWRRQNPDYLALMGGPHGGLVGFLEADISRGDYASAAVLWDSLKQQGAITTTLETALTNAIAQFNLGELGAALTAHNQAQN